MAFAYLETSEGRDLKVRGELRNGKRKRAEQRTENRREGRPVVN